MKLPIYLDYQATTPVDPLVLESMLPYFTEQFGNPASRSHEFGWVAEAAVEKARTQVAALIGATEYEITFTSGATESANLAVFGVLGGSPPALGFPAGRHLVTTQVEHQAVLGPCRQLEKQGIQVTYVKVDRYGRVDPADVEAAIRPETRLISVMAANNEIGTINPMAEIGRIAKARGVLFHSDATQAIAKIPVDVEAWEVDLLSFNAHKMYGPKGVGALYRRRRSPRVPLSAQIFGGGHERGLRSGTLNVPAIVGFGRAAELAVSRLTEDAERMRRLRDRLRQGLLAGVRGTRVHGHPSDRLPDNLSVSFDGVDGQALMLGVREICVSSGSACMSASLEPSHVLKAIGLDDETARSALRMSVGRTTLEAEVDYAMIKVIEKIGEFRRVHDNANPVASIP